MISYLEYRNSINLAIQSTGGHLSNHSQTVLPKNSAYPQSRKTLDCQGRQTGGWGVGGSQPPLNFGRGGLNTCQPPPPPLILRGFLLQEVGSSYIDQNL